MSERDWSDLATGIDLVATDLDGTLLRADTTVSERTVETLAAARRAGLPVVYVTGRPPRWIVPVARATGHSGIGIGGNGAVVLDLATGRLVESFPIEPDALDAVVETLRREVPGIAFAVEWADDTSATAETFAYESAFITRFPIGLPAHDGDVREAARGRRVIKLLARVSTDDHDADTFVDLALGHVEHLVTVTHSNSDDVLLEMSARGVTKGSTLARLADGLGVPAQRAAAAGDMPNDVPMLSWAGVGLGVRDAHPLVLAVADAVLPPADDDGVARFVAAVLDAR
ncbi:MAG: HAD family hydrolase [Candidatus Nanopelagicales bacterium]